MIVIYDYLLNCYFNNSNSAVLNTKYFVYFNYVFFRKYTFDNIKRLFLNALVLLVINVTD